MCTTCGCGDAQTHIEGAALDHDHDHDHDHPHHHPHHHGPQGQHRHAAADHDHRAWRPAHSHAPGLSPARMVKIEQDILAKNAAFARENRAYLEGRRVFALNLVSSPGSGKTTLLVRTIEALRPRQEVLVIEGDQQTSHDAERIRASGARALQINTGKGCHLDAHMVGHALRQLDPPERALLMIENVGNLVCPAAFDLGEAHKVVVLSVTEGWDKPLKYPDMFRAARLMLLNKCDLLPYVDFDVERAKAAALAVNPSIEILQLSATRGDGMADWLAWIERARPAQD